MVLATERCSRSVPPAPKKGLLQVFLLALTVIILAGLIEINSMLYGTAAGGGVSGGGTAFKITTGGDITALIALAPAPMEAALLHRYSMCEARCTERPLGAALTARAPFSA